MCTVSFVKTNTGFILTANRDEDIRRKTIPPASYFIESEKLIFPKDEKAGGTWVALNINKRRACTLLNGAFKPHAKSSNFTKSRGLILLNALAHSSLKDFIENEDLTEVEPFTLLWIDFVESDKVNLSEIIWDGANIHTRTILDSEPKLWSSSTIYSEQAKQARAKLYQNHLASQTTKSKDGLFAFHSKAHGLGKEDDILMQRDQHFKTISISQLVLENQYISFRYFDLQSKSEHKINTLLTHV